jgi:hypothetical protein
MELKEALVVLKQVIDQSISEGVFKHIDGVITVHNAFQTILNKLKEDLPKDNKIEK